MVGGNGAAFAANIWNVITSPNKLRTTGGYQIAEFAVWAMIAGPVAFQCFQDTISSAPILTFIQNGERLPV